MNRHEHRGSCHCGNLRWTLRSELSLAQLPVRTCGWPLLPQAWSADDLGSAGRDGFYLAQSYSGPPLSFRH